MKCFKLTQNTERPSLKPTVLLLSTYPLVEPRHGGQVRLANISKAYRDAGWEVESIAVYEPDAYTARELGKRDIPLPIDSPYRKFRGHYVPLINDLLSGNYAVADDGGFPAITKNLPASLDAIHVEQPYLWPVAARLKEFKQYRQTLLIYGSANIEAQLKEDILKSYNVVDDYGVVAETSTREKKAATEADITIAVTEFEREIMTSWGAKYTILAPNGVSPPCASDDIIDKWKQRLPREPWVLYVASAHPPNFTDFGKCIGDSLGCIPPTSRLVVAGSVCEHLYNQLASTRWSTLNLSRLEPIWSLADEDLSAVRMLAHAHIIPILHGGGSNLKTAEALYSGAYVIGTKEAFRGFEKFVELPMVYVARSPGEFQKAIRDTLAKPPVPKNNESGLRESLRWDMCLNSIPKSVDRVLQNRAAQ